MTASGVRLLIESYLSLATTAFGAFELNVPRKLTKFHNMSRQKRREKQKISQTLRSATGGLPFDNLTQGRSSPLVAVQCWGLYSSLFFLLWSAIKCYWGPWIANPTTKNAALPPPRKNGQEESRLLNSRRFGSSREGRTLARVGLGVRTRRIKAYLRLFPKSDKSQDFPSPPSLTCPCGPNPLRTPAPWTCFGPDFDLKSAFSGPNRVEIGSKSGWVQGEIIYPPPPQPHVARYLLRKVSTPPKWWETPFGTYFHTSTSVQYPFLQLIARYFGDTL